jgi:hypothetical protein
MTLARSFLVIVTLAGIASGATPKAFLAVYTNKRSCTMEIIRVDDHALKSPQQHMTLSPGRHLIFVRVRDARGKVYDAGGLDYTFKAGHQHSIIGWWTADDKMTIRVGDETAATADRQQPKHK